MNRMRLRVGQLPPGQQVVALPAVQRYLHGERGAPGDVPDRELLRAGVDLPAHIRDLEEISLLTRSWSAGSANVIGTMPQLIRLARWMRANALAITPTTPRYIGAIAACSRLLPWP